MTTTAIHIALIGMAGVGKSVVARRLGAAMGRSVVDVDAAVVAGAGMSIQEIFERDGEPEFRRLEAEALGDALSSSEPLVIATGGGIVVAAENRDELRSRSRCVWLRAEPEVLARRLERSPARRPLLDGNLRSNMTRLLGERSHLYDEAADVIVDIEDHNADAVTALVVDALSIGSTE